MGNERIHQMLQLALKEIEDSQVLTQTASRLNEIQDRQVLETQAASRQAIAAAQLKQLAELIARQYVLVPPQKGPSFPEMLQLAAKGITNHQYDAAIEQLRQLADLADTTLAPAWDELLTRWTLTFQTRLRAALADPTVDSDTCRALETSLRECLQGEDFAGALKVLDRLEPALKKAVFDGNLVKGKTKKLRDQTHAYEAAKNRFDIIRNTAFRNGHSKHILGQNLNATNELRSFLVAMEAHEDNRSEKTLEVLEALGRTFLGSDARPGEMEIVRQMMQWARFDGLRMEYQKIGPPRWGAPWDAENENRAGALTAAYLFEEGALISRTGDDKTAKRLEDESGVSGAWWIRRLGGVLGEEAVRQFIFKPVDCEPLFAELPKGGGAIREFMAKAVNDQVALMTGLDFGVCPTYLVGVSNERLPEANGRPDTTLGPVRTGAIQQLALNRGPVEECFNEGGPAFFKEIPTEEVHKVAILDLIILNLDRHGRNVLVDGYPPRIIPIDHGKSLPSREGFSVGKEQIETQNYFVRHGAPQMDERFAPEMLAIIDLIDPDRLVQGMAESRDALVKQYPDQKDKLGDESVEMVRRSVLFLKKAASHLTVKELMKAYVIVLEPVFDTALDKLEAAVDHAVRMAVDLKAAGQWLDAYGRENAKKELRALGWFTINPNDPTRILNDEDQDRFLKQGGRVLKILQGKIENPAVRTHFEKLLREVGYNELDFDVLPTLEALTRLQKAADERQKLALEEFRLRANDKLGAALGDSAEKLLADLKESVADLTEFDEAGGEKLVPEAAGKAPDKKLELYGQKLMKVCAGSENPRAYKEKLKLYGQELMNEVCAGSQGAEAYYKQMNKEFGGLVKLSPWPELGKARYVQVCQRFQSLGGKAEYKGLVRKPYSVNNGPAEAMLAMLKAKSDASVDGMDLNAARKNAIKVGIQRLQKVASAPIQLLRDVFRSQSIHGTEVDSEVLVAPLFSRTDASDAILVGQAKRRIERGIEDLQVNLDSGRYDAAEKILVELEAEVDRVIRGDNSDIARLDSRIKAAKEKVTALQHKVTALPPSKEQQAVTKALEALKAVEDLRKAWKLSPCETALGKLEKSADTIAKKQAVLIERRKYQASSELQKLDNGLKELHTDIRQVKKNPYLKGRYAEFSRRYWDAIKTKEEWNIDEATKLIERIKREIEVVQTMVPELDMLQKRIDEAVVQIKKLPTNVSTDPTYVETYVGLLTMINGVRTGITKVGAAALPVGLDNRHDLEIGLQNYNKQLDDVESELANIVEKYLEKQ